MTILNVDGRNLDIYDNMNINLNYQLNKISDLATRNSTYSNTITLPRTTKNSIIFENLGMFGNTSTVPYKKVKCNYTQNGILLLNNGYIQVTDATPDTFKVVIYSGIIDMIERLNGKNLEDLNFTPYEHDISQISYLNSFTNTSGYIYGIGDFGNGIKETGAIQIDYQAPSFYMHTIFDMILTEAGYTYSGDIFNTVDFKNKVVTPTDGWEVPDGTSIDTFLGSYNTKEINEFNRSDRPNTYVFNLEFEDLTPGPGYSLIDSKTIRVNHSGQHRFDFSTTVEIDNGDVSIQYLRNGVQFYGETFIEERPTETQTRTLQAYFISGDIIKANVIGYSRTFDDIHYWSRFKINSSFSGASQNISFNGVNAVFQGVSQTSFIKDIMQKYGLILKINDTNHLTFITMEELLNDKSNAENWTKKINIDSIDENYVLQNYGINNLMKYKYQVDDENLEPFEGSFDGKMVINNEHLEFEKTLFTSIFSARYMSFYKHNSNIWKIPLWKREEKDNGEVIIKKNKGGISFFDLEKKYIDLRIKLYKDGSATPHNIIAPFLAQEGIHYQNFINKYYKNVNQLLNRNKILTIEANINEDDLKNLDFFKLKYLEQTGKFYYLNSIKAPKNGIAKVELVELN